MNNSIIIGVWSRVSASFQPLPSHQIIAGRDERDCRWWWQHQSFRPSLLRNPKPGTPAQLFGSPFEVGPVRHVPTTLYAAKMMPKRQHYMPAIVPPRRGRDGTFPSDQSSRVRNRVNFRNDQSIPSPSMSSWLNSKQFSLLLTKPSFSLSTGWMEFAVAIMHAKVVLTGSTA